MNSIEYITVSESEDSDCIEIPLEEDDTVLLSTVAGIYPKVCGLKYRSPETNSYRALKFSNGKFFRPPEGWYGIIFYCVFPKDNNKRKGVEEVEKPNQKTKRLEGRRCTDLIVLNIGWKVDENMLKEYFSQFGELVLVQIKRERDTNNSKGYGFIRFADYSSQVLCLAEKHLIDGRWCDVKVPFSKVEADEQEISKKIHVAYSSEDITLEDLRALFEDYGYVTDIFVPKPFRNFAFVTFDSCDSAQHLIGRTLSIRGHSLTIGSAVPKINNRKNQQQQLFQHQQNAIQIYPESPIGTPNQQYQAARYAAAAAASGMMQPYGWQTTFGVATQKMQPGAAAAFANYGGQLQMNHQNQSFMIANGGGRTNDSFQNYGGNGSGFEAMQQGYMASQFGGGDCGTQGTAASTALSLLKNPDVVAAIVAAANKAASGQMHHGKYQQ